MSTANPRRFAYMPGSFDPVHEGHAAILTPARNEFGYERIFLGVATDSNPMKKYFYPGPKRASLLESAMLPYRNFVTVERSQIDGRSDHPFGSIDLLSRELGSDTELDIIVGQDLYETFTHIYDKWRKPDHYLENYNWVVVRRDGSSELLVPGNVLGFSKLALGDSASIGNGRMLHYRDYSTPRSSSSDLKSFLCNVDNLPGCFMCTRQFYREIVETPRFYVMYNEFPLMEGQLLIASKAHIGSLGLISQSALMELHIIKERVREVLTDLYGGAAFYENGRRTCCIVRNEDRHITNHLHLNALPFTGDISGELRAKYPERKIRSVFSLKGFGGVYFYFERNDGESFFYDLTGKPPSHNELRTLIANKLGNPEVASWDGKTVMFSQTPEAAETLTRLRRAFGRVVSC